MMFMILGVITGLAILFGVVFPAKLLEYKSEAKLPLQLLKLRYGIYLNCAKCDLLMDVNLTQTCCMCKVHYYSFFQFSFLPS